MPCLEVSISELFTYWLIYTLSGPSSKMLLELWMEWGWHKWFIHNWTTATNLNTEVLLAFKIDLKKLITLLFQHELSKLFLWVNFSVWTLESIYATTEHGFYCCVCYINLKRSKLLYWVIQPPKMNNFFLLIKIYFCTFQIYFKYSLKYI